MTRADMVVLAKRLSLMVGGEAMQSGFHFALNLALLRVLSAQDYGIFAIVMVIGGLSLTYVRSLTAMPASIWIGRSRTRYAAGAFEVAFGSGAALLAVVTGLAVGLLLQLWLGSGAVAGGAFVALWSLRSHLRTAYFALGRPKLVSFSDLVFTFCGLCVAAVALWRGGDDLLGNVLSALAIANGLGIAVLLGLARRPVRVTLRRSVRRRYSRLGRTLAWSFVSVTMANLQGQGMALLVAAVAGPAAYAPIAAVLVLFVPLRVGAAAFVNMIQPDVAGLMARGEIATVWRDSKVWSVLMGLGGIAYGAATLLLLPYVKSQALEGTPIYLMGFFAWAIYTMTMLYVMPRVVLEVQSAFRTVAVITAGAALVGMGMIWIILHVAASPWSLAGGAASEVIVLVASWVMMRRRLDALDDDGVAGCQPAWGPARRRSPSFAPPVRP